MEIIKMEKKENAYLFRNDIIALIKISSDEKPKIEDIRKLIAEKEKGEIIVKKVEYMRIKNTIKVLASSYREDKKDEIKKIEPAFILKKNYGEAKEGA
ncbi:MAG: hypothetical protein OH318_02805 [Candidatus Parvarchaeota archaeon]|nr:hypothetical protein [Candidatus Rehaiarchaeum fermentans]MCW1293292.1 hypothetical protein [Candidatus Rehaiarchaeum fermentans]